MDYLTIILIFIITGLGVWIWQLLRVRVRPGIIEKQAEKMATNRQEVLKFLENVERIRNNDVEKLLKVSNATAERYLAELEKQGVLKQVGDIGQGVYYVKI